MYAMFEHSFYTRAAKDGSKEDEARGVFKFLPLVAPIKATVFPLLQKPELNEVGEWGQGCRRERDGCRGAMSSKGKGVERG